MQPSLHAYYAIGNILDLDGGWQWERGTRIRNKKGTVLGPKEFTPWVGRGLEIHCTTLNSYLCYAGSMSKVL